MIAEALTTRFDVNKKNARRSTDRRLSAETPRGESESLILLRVLVEELLGNVALDLDAVLGRFGFKRVHHVREHLLFLRAEVRGLRGDQRQKLFDLAQAFVDQLGQSLRRVGILRGQEDFCLNSVRDGDAAGDGLQSIRGSPGKLL